MDTVDVMERNARWGLPHKSERELLLDVAASNAANALHAARAAGVPTAELELLEAESARLNLAWVDARYGRGAP